MTQHRFGISTKSVFQFFILTWSLQACRNEQSFEGVIRYQHAIESCSPRYPLGMLKSTVDTASTYYYRSGNYKWVNESALFAEDLYLAAENRNYFKVGGGDVYYGEGSEQNEDILGYSMKENQERILGYRCDLLDLVTRSRKDHSIVYRSIWYSPQIRIDSSAFSKLQYLSHDFIASKTHSIPLRIVMQNPEFSITWEAVSVEFQELNDSLFLMEGMEDAMPVNRLSF